VRAGARGDYQADGGGRTLSANATRRWRDASGRASIGVDENLAGAADTAAITGAAEWAAMHTPHLAASMVLVCECATTAHADHKVSNTASNATALTATRMHFGVS
jgi:hypothetical protein